MFSKTIISLCVAAFFPLISQALKIQVETSQDFPKRLEIENMALRPSGAILAVSYASEPHIFQVEPIANSTPKLIYTFQNATGISSISESSNPDEYFLITGNFSFQTFEPTVGSYAIHRLSFDSCNEPIVKEIATLEKLAQPNGMITIPNTPYVLIADTFDGIVYRFNTDTLSLTTYLDHPLLKPDIAAIRFGVNGIKLSRGYFYFSNTNHQFIARAKVSGKEATLVSEPEIIINNTPIDDFIVNELNGDLFLAEANGGSFSFVDGKAINGTLAVPEILIGGGNSTALLDPTAVIWQKGAEGWKLVISNSGDLTPLVDPTANATIVGKLTFVTLLK